MGQDVMSDDGLLIGTDVVQIFPDHRVTIITINYNHRVTIITTFCGEKRYAFKANP